MSLSSTLPPAYTAPEQVPLALTIEEAAVLLRVSRASIYRKIKDGTFCFPVVQVGSAIRIPSAPILRALGGGE